MQSQISFRRASAEGASPDVFSIADLYLRVYQGNYPDPIMSDPHALREALGRPDYLWILAEAEGRVIGSVVYRYSAANALAKVFGAVIEPLFRGRHLTEQLMQFGYRTLRRQQPPVEVVYATTRTVSPAPQRLTERLGYRKLGIFPNVHKTDGYETHCLTAHFTESALAQRFTDFLLHPKVYPVFDLVRKECGLPDLGVAQDSVFSGPIEARQQLAAAGEAPIDLETLRAPHFARYRFYRQFLNSGEDGEEHHWFFPFQEPNLLLSSPDQKVEVFCFFSPTDQHCVLIGVRDVDQVGFGRILENAAKMLHDLGVRYLEFIMRADEIQKIDLALRADFIPCAYFPAMHLAGGRRYDFVAFSRSYEILNFKNIRLEGLNRAFLRQYLDRWRETALEIGESDRTES